MFTDYIYAAFDQWGIKYHQCGWLKAILCLNPHERLGMTLLDGTNHLNNQEYPEFYENMHRAMDVAKYLDKGALVQALEGILELVYRNQNGTALERLDTIRAQLDSES